MVRRKRKLDNAPPVSAHSLTTALLDLLWPRTCAGCGSARADGLLHLCWECRAAIRFVQPPYCTSCGDPVPGRIDHEYRCAFCSQHGPHFDLARSVAHYEEPLSSLLRGLKYRGAVWLRNDLAALLETCVRSFADVDRFDAVAPVPLHHTRRRGRGFNQAHLIARGLARRLRVPLFPRLLARTRQTPTQTNLTAAERIANVHNAFRARHRSWLEGRRILLVDDVMTTGATVNACARALKKGGAARVDVVTVARG
jgi:ComF family protein